MAINSKILWRGIKKMKKIFVVLLHNDTIKTHLLLYRHRSPSFISFFPDIEHVLYNLLGRNVQGRIGKKLEMNRMVKKINWKRMKRNEKERKQS